MIDLFNRKRFFDKRIRENLILILIIISFNFLIFNLFLNSYNINDSHLIYALDDPYIHMSIAKNLIKYGVWGINKYEFVSVSSSPFWTILLSIIYLIFGVKDYIPFVLNIIIANLIIIYTYLILKKFKISNLLTFITLILIIFITPMPTLIFIGMEHLLHIFFILFFLKLFIEIFYSNQNISSLKIYLFYIVNSILPLIRYESLFLLPPLIIFLLYKRKIKFLINILIFIFVPIIIFGLISKNYGGFFIPNSLILKNGINLESLLKYIFLKNFKLIYRNKVIYFQILISFFILIFYIMKTKEFFIKEVTINFIFIILAIIHSILIRNEQLYRYDAYIVFIGLFSIFSSIELLISIFIKIIFVSIKKIINSIKIDKKSTKFDFKNVLSLLLIIIFVSVFTNIVYENSKKIIYPFYFRATDSYKKIVVATNNIYKQQFQMAKFIKYFYNEEKIAINDIGAISYYTDVYIIDLVGLGNNELAKLKINKNYNSKNLLNILDREDINLIIIYDSWFKNFIKDLNLDYIKVCEWKINNNVVCGSDIVSFYVRREPEKIKTLIINLKNFCHLLPKDISIKFFY